MVEVEGPKELVSPLLNEGGGHRWQRIPPTEKRGRVHTSTVKIAVFELKTQQLWTLKDSDIDIITTRDSGPGGQHRNTTDSCVIMTHKPTGITAKAAEKSQHKNKITAREILESRVFEHFDRIKRDKASVDRRNQFGSGMRGDKIRTYREQDNMVINHATNTKVSLTKVLNGGLNNIW